jgi:hypothetical protein
VNTHFRSTTFKTKSISEGESNKTQTDEVTEHLSTSVRGELRTPVRNILICFNRNVEILISAQNYLHCVNAKYVEITLVLQNSDSCNSTQSNSSDIINLVECLSITEVGNLKFNCYNNCLITERQKYTANTTERH